MAKKREDMSIYHVVVNSESRYSIWPDGRELPAGWTLTGKSGLQWECVDYIGEVWLDEPDAEKKETASSAS